MLGNGKAVSDYAMVSPELLPHVLQLQVLAWHPAALFTDHATLHLEMSIPSMQPQRGAAEQPPAQPGQADRQPAPQLRQFLPPRYPEQLAAAVEALTRLCDQLSALADAADAASSVADLDAVSAWLSEVVCSALAAGGRREKRQGRPQSQPKPKLPRHLPQEFGIRQLRRSARQAIASGDAAQQAAARQQLKRAARKAHRAASRLRGKAHEALMCSDPSAFFRPFNRAAKVMSAIPTDTLVRHFCTLLGGDQPPEPPPEPPPAAMAAAHEQQADGQACVPEHQMPRNPHLCSPAHAPCSSARLSVFCAANPAAAEGSPQQAAVAAAAVGPHSGSPSDSSPASRQQEEQLGSLKARMHAPFTASEVAAHSRQLKNRKAVAGSLPPWFLKAAAAQLAPAIAALSNAWVRLGQLPAADALSLITAIPKPGAAADSCDGLRGIAVGILPAKLFACMLERRISDWAEASGSRAAGQFGFRRQRSTAQAALVLRTILDLT